MTASASNNAGHFQSRWTMAGFAVAIGAALLLLVVNGAVGFLGSEDNPYNAILAAVPAAALIGSIFARLRPGGMVRAMQAAAAVQIIVAVVALAAGLGSAGWKGVYEVFLGTTLFTGLWLLSARLFAKAARNG